LQRGQPTDALRHFREALRLNPMSDSARRGLLMAASAKGAIARELTKWTLWFDTLTDAQRRRLAAGILGLIFALFAAAKWWPAVPPIAWIAAGIRVIAALLMWMGRSWRSG
jgi:hypothetical protein